jgi:hypothetical protein
MVTCKAWLAKAAGVALSTIRGFEKGAQKHHAPQNLATIRRVLEAADVQF